MITTARFVEHILSLCKNFIVRNRYRERKCLGKNVVLFNRKIGFYFLANLIYNWIQGIEKFRLLSVSQLPDYGIKTGRTIWL